LPPTLSPTLALTPHGQLRLVERDDAPPVADAVAAGLREGFGRGAAWGLLSLGLREVGVALPPTIAWWRDLAARFVTALCTLPEVEDVLPDAVPVPPDAALQAEIDRAPPMDGAEYLRVEVLQARWRDLDAALRAELAGAPLSAWLSAHHPAWNLVGRVCVHLAENRKDDEAPFAFLATYTTRLSAQGRAQHAPLGRALQEYASAQDRDRLLALLTPLQRAAERCGWLRELIASRAIFQPLRWTAADAVRLLTDVPELERAGVVVRMPAAWRANRPARAVARATVGAGAPGHVGRDALLDFSVELAVDGAPLTPDEARALLAADQGLVMIRGQWVEVDAARLRKTLDRLQAIQAVAATSGLGFHEAMRLLAGTGSVAEDGVAPEVADWSEVVAGPWLAEALAGLRGPEGLAAVEPGPELKATLRPYQAAGLRWLRFVTGLRLGACLADDMGLGKTLQVLSLLLVAKRTDGAAPNLLVAPASLLANWAQEAARFTPTLSVLVAHPSAMPADALAALTPERLAAYDLVITSYGTLLRATWPTAVTWRLAVIDEAQAIKNPGTRQTRAVKALPARSRIALTGTPIENRLGDLWSIFDFINPGLLGTAAAFGRFTKRLADAPGGYAPLRALVQPYVLRRLKTDKSVIHDLPDKTELHAFCGLSRTQAALYQAAVDELAQALRAVDGIQRKGLILTFLMRFKQICNHPSQWSGDGSWAEADSGKLVRLRELAEVIAAKQEKVLVFSQFREVTAPLAAFLGAIFGRPGLVLTGETPVRQRSALVRRFQEDESVPFFVLSLKAGGAGLNLTAASHVIHFDRWWNPAVENQATDRAFRIGQSRNVLVHKFVCRGTVEEKIDALIASKRQLSADLLDGGAEVNLTALDDRAILDLVRLDLNAVQSEG
jgi:superfamily II DNA or RNA helicase